MPVISTATTANHTQVGKHSGEPSVKTAKLIWITIVKRFGGIKFRVAQSRCIRTNATNPFNPTIAS